jgi:hypothetical protein
MITCGLACWTCTLMAKHSLFYSCLQLSGTVGFSNLAARLGTIIRYTGCKT